MVGSELLTGKENRRFQPFFFNEYTGQRIEEEVAELNSCERRKRVEARESIFSKHDLEPQRAPDTSDKESAGRSVKKVVKRSARSPWYFAHV